MRAKKHAMRTRRQHGEFTRRLDRSYRDLLGGEVRVSVNRRGCTNRWSPESERALKALALAAVEMHRSGHLPAAPEAHDAR